ncbi:unnamed protein product [Caenorhabditis nigoni]
MKTRFLYSFSLILLIFRPDFVFAADCTQKSFKTGTVCVCSLDSCDEIPALDITMGQAALYTTSNSGARLHRDLVYATDAEPFGTLHMTIDSSKKYQTIQGFGSTFSDASGANLKSLPDKLADTVIRQYFSESGLNLQFGRVPMASTDFSGRVYSYNDVPEDYMMKNFNLTREDFQWKIPYIQAAKRYNPNLKLFGAPWSAPGWMKTTKEMSGPGALNGHAGDNYHKAYATYFVKFLEEYAKSGINFWALSTQNQPTLGSDKKNKIQSTLFTAETRVRTDSLDNNTAETAHQKASEKVRRLQQKKEEYDANIRSLKDSMNGESGPKQWKNSKDCIKKQKKIRTNCLKKVKEALKIGKRAREAMEDSGESD